MTLLYLQLATQVGGWKDLATQGLPLPLVPIRKAEHLP